MQQPKYTRCHVPTSTMSKLANSLPCSIGSHGSWSPQPIVTGTLIVASKSSGKGPPEYEMKSRNT